MAVKLRCERVTKYVMPAVRGLIAKTLIEEYGFSQSSAAKVLGISQAAVSYYISSKRGYMMSKKLEKNKMVMEAIRGLARKVAETKGSKEVELNLCDICNMLNKIR